MPQRDQVLANGPPPLMVICEWRRTTVRQVAAPCAEAAANRLRRKTSKRLVCRSLWVLTIDDGDTDALPEFRFVI